MGIFKKSIRHSKGSNLDEKLKMLESELKKTDVAVNDSDKNFLYEQKNKENEVVKYSWREDAVPAKNDILTEEISVVRESKVNNNSIKKVKGHINSVEEELSLLRKQIFDEISENFLFNIPSIEKKVDKVLRIYNDLQEGLLNQPPETVTTDPLTPLDQNFVTIEDLNKHYNLFINRIQEQIATVGGGGETKLKYLDDVVGIATNASAYDGKYLKYDHTLGKFVFETVVGGGGPGTQGIQGIQGVDGANGTNGTQGVQGIQGVGGTNGSQGVQGIQGSASTVQGIQGTQGVQGIQGTTGNFGGVTFDFTFDSNTSDTDPGSGRLKLNNASVGIATELYIDDQDDNATDIQDYLRTIDDSTSSIKGHFRITNKSNASDFALFVITGSSVEGTGYFKIPCGISTASASSFSNDEDVIITFARTGDKGDSGTQGTQGIQGVTGSGAQGTAGTQGSGGTQGTQGSQGRQGIQGVQGYGGTQGSQGRQGVQGIQGTIGAGTQGTQGVQGEAGTQGSGGIQGANGATGSQGVQGNQGLQGGQGVQGNDGSATFQGYQGIQGVAGSNGTQGNQGISGEAAAQGYQGIQGVVGGQGVQGTQGVQGSDATVQGIQGIQGSNGTQGTTGTGSQGIQGSQGTGGATGGPGAQGIQGNDGAFASQGIQGTQGVQGVQGTQASQGTQGIQGITGAGTQGIQGITGTGTQGVQGTTGTATQGIQGITGSQGTQGIAGSAAAQGIQGVQGPAGAGGGGGESYWVATGVGIHTLSNVGIATTNPVSKLQVERYGVSTGFGTFNSTVGVATDIDSFTIATTDFKTAEYTLHVGYGTYIQSQKVLVMQNGTTAYSQEYAIMYDPSIVVSVGATVSAGVCKLQATPEAGVTGLTTYRFVRTTLL